MCLRGYRTIESSGELAIKHASLFSQDFAWWRPRCYNNRKYRDEQILVPYTLPTKTSGKQNGDTPVWHFNLLKMAWHQLQLVTETLIQLLRVSLVLSMKIAARNVRILHRNMQFFTTSPKIFYNFQAINHYVVKIWGHMCVYSLIRYSHHAKFATARRITHYSDVIMGVIASQITSLASVYSAV